MNIFLWILTGVFSFILTLILTKFWIKVAKKNELVGKDMNKLEKPNIPESGGVAVSMGIIISILFFIFLKTFFTKEGIFLSGYLAVCLTILLAVIIGFIDDILGWKKGLKSWQKIVSTLPIVIPLMVIAAGSSIMAIPFLGVVKLGLIYSLVVVPLGIIGATNGFNLLAGMNGLEAGLGIITFLGLAITSVLIGNFSILVVCMIVVLALIAFLIFNKYPSKIFPGDSLTYAIGAAIACVAILGNMEKVAFFFFIPFIIEGFLKLKSKFGAECFGKIQEDGSLEPPEGKSRSLTHIAMKLIKKIKKSHKVYEKEVVFLLWGFQALVVAIVLILNFVV